MSDRRVCANIYLNRLEANFRLIREKTDPGSKICAVIKTDAYGHGALEAAKRLEGIDQLWGFAVAAPEEGLSLRRGGIKKPVLVLGVTFPEDDALLVEEQISPAVADLTRARELSEAAQKAGKTLGIHIAVDTGMTRIGFFPGEEAARQIAEISQLPGLRIDGIFTHFARADEKDKTCARKAYETFASFCDTLKERGIRIPLRHCANSASILELPDVHMDMVRAGIILYGIYPSDEVERNSAPLSAVMELKSHVTMVRTLPSGTPVSYGGTYVTTKETVIATIPVGYGDGYPRSLSNKGEVLIGGKRVRIIGRVCMDQMMVDVTGLEVRPGQEVTLLGRDGSEEITIDELAEGSGRFPYEFVCCIGKRVPRRYLDE